MTQERYRETVTDELLEKYGEEFAVLMGQATHNGWQAEGPTCEWLTPPRPPLPLSGYGLRYR